MELNVCVVDDTRDARESISMFLRASGLPVESYDSAEAFLEEGLKDSLGCLVLDLNMPKMSGLELQNRLAEAGRTVPIVFLSGMGDLSAASAAFRSGAVDFLEKPVEPQRLLERVKEALSRASEQRQLARDRRLAVDRLKLLTKREREVLGHVICGTPNKVIARHLGVSHRTIEAHRAHIMEKMQAGSLVELVEAAHHAGIEGEPID
jgi:two-component system response regulator FixJ